MGLPGLSTAGVEPRLLLHEQQGAPSWPMHVPMPQLHASHVPPPVLCLLRRWDVKAAQAPGSSNDACQHAAKALLQLCTAQLLPHKSVSSKPEVK